MNWLRAIGVAGVFLMPAVWAEDLPVFKVAFRNGVFTPARIEVPAGQKVKIEVLNAGTTAMEFESHPLKKEKVLAPGAYSFLVIAPLAPGEYPFYDDFHEDASGGVIVAK